MDCSVALLHHASCKHILSGHRAYHSVISDSFESCSQIRTTNKNNKAVMCIYMC